MTSAPHTDSQASNLCPIHTTNWLWPWNLKRIKAKQLLSSWPLTLTVKSYCQRPKSMVISNTRELSLFNFRLYIFLPFFFLSSVSFLTAFVQLFLSRSFPSSCLRSLIWLACNVSVHLSFLFFSFFFYCFFLFPRMQSSVRYCKMEYTPNYHFFLIILALLVGTCPHAGLFFIPELESFKSVHVYPFVRRLNADIQFICPT